MYEYQAILDNFFDYYEHSMHPHMRNVSNKIYSTAYPILQCLQAILPCLATQIQILPCSASSYIQSYHA
jgi:hypothetical protein